MDQFKVGDKVRMIRAQNPWQDSQTGTVIKSYKYGNEDFIRVRFNDVKLPTTNFYSWRFEHLTIVGQTLKDLGVYDRWPHLKEDA